MSDLTGNDWLGNMKNPQTGLKTDKAEQLGTDNTGVNQNEYQDILSTEDSLIDDETDGV
jgi:hypothetical protein